MALSSDPHEQRLFQMFQAHDVNSRGSLDREALGKLCRTLELKERGQQLVKCLLRDEKSRVTFQEFREGLLHILGVEEPEDQAEPKSLTLGDRLDSADSHNVSTGSPTAVSSSPASSCSSSGNNSNNNRSNLNATAGSIISNTSKQQHHQRSHPHSYQQRQTVDRDAQHRAEYSESVAKVVPKSAVPLCVEEDRLLTSATDNPSNPITTTSDNENESSDREVSPKFVVGTKKYGRRSRPRDESAGLDTSSDFSNSDNESVPPNQQKQEAGSKNSSSSKVQRSASQSDIHGTKRRRPMSGARLKRCVSLPTHRQRPDLAQSKLNAKAVRDQLNMDEQMDRKIYLLKLYEKLRDIWDSLLVDGHGTLLNQSQLEVVCERAGLQELPAKLAAREVFAKLRLEPIEGIGFDEFMSLLQSDSDILPIGGGGGGGGGCEKKTVADGDCVVTARMFGESDTFKAQELDRDSVEETVGFSVQMPDWTAEIGSLSSSIIIDMWESAGIVDARNLLHDLGFYDDEIQVTNLASALEDEQQRLGDCSETYAFVKASQALHKAENSALRQAFVQLVEENKKLYADNKEVNQRALLIAQEVDERHNSLEAATRNKIRLLEQRHHETVKELTSQLAFEREQLTGANAALEKRIHAFELEESRQKAEMSRLADENDSLRVEQENLTKEMADLLEKNIRLNKDITELEENNRNDVDDGFGRKDDVEVLELIEKISLLQCENSELRDKNDELSAEIEMLGVELARFKPKRSGVSRTSTLEVSPVVVESAGVGGEENASAARKRQGDSPSKARLSDESPRLGKLRKCSKELENESDSSGDWVALQSELGMKVDSTMASSGISHDYSSNNESSFNDEEVRQLKVKIEELEKKLEEHKTGSSGDKTEAERQETASAEGAERSEKDKLKIRCEELEASLEQMSKEYEACEDYWQNKVNEERQLFEEEQRISDDKFNELLKKMAEYEEQFAGQGSSKADDGRLSPIEEKDILEQQYLDLELELQEAQRMIEEKSHEVDRLRNRIVEFEQLTKYSSEAMLATPPRVETPEIDSPASSPISYLMKQGTIQAPTRDYQNPNWPLKSVNQNNPADIIGEVRRNPSHCEGDDDDQLLATSNEDSGFNRTISPIQKPTASVSDVASCGAIDHQADLVDSSDTGSVKSARSMHSLASTHSIHKSVSQTDIASATQDQLKQLRLMQLQLQDEIKELTHQRDCLKAEFQQLCEAKPILARAYTKTAHPNQTQKIQHLEQKIRHQQQVMKQQQMYSENILHQIWQQQRSEITELRNRLEAQSMVISDQATRLASNDLLVKDLYVENSHLMTQVQRLEQQKARATLLQQLSQATANAHHQATAHHPSQLSGIMPGLP
ncbi:blastoderm-specific protein 25D [Sabethes cyaneus]|uniref:blastoderm-specific protein 25D n=1 Tax=Sabethes cyaneus TaxID=53552 RepID=UPI00237E4DE6|nr:blastoderm-specific protein 25D [Sabethes cyaneus]